MTYKGIIEMMIERESINWVEDLLKKNGFENYCTIGNGVEITKDKRVDYFLFDAKIKVFGLEIGVNNEKQLIIGGTVDDTIGICTSVIWNADKSKVIWTSASDTRDLFKITDFEII